MVASIASGISKNARQKACKRRMSTPPSFTCNGFHSAASVLHKELLVPRNALRSAWCRLGSYVASVTACPPRLGQIGPTRTRASQCGFGQVVSGRQHFLLNSGLHCCVLCCVDGTNSHNDQASDLFLSLSSRQCMLESKPSPLRLRPAARNRAACRQSWGLLLIGGKGKRL